MIAHRSGAAPKLERGAGQACERLPKDLPDIELNHGSALWVLAELGFRGEASNSTFREYIKSLRKLGIPFEPGEIGLGRRGLAIYAYSHLMELALMLTLRVYHVVPDALLKEIVRYRTRLYHHYRYAYRHRRSGPGAPIVMNAGGTDPLCIRGVFLDLQINFSGGKLVNFGPPRVISPVEALAVFAGSVLAARALLPLNLSLLAERVVSTALRVTSIRGRPRDGKASRGDVATQHER
jgi:hypothetical protein